MSETKECLVCQGKGTVIRGCGCLAPCVNCDEFEYEECRFCLNGELEKTSEDFQDELENALEFRREVLNDR